MRSPPPVEAASRVDGQSAARFRMAGGNARKAWHTEALGNLMRDKATPAQVEEKTRLDKLLPRLERFRKSIANNIPVVERQANNRIAQRNKEISTARKASVGAFFQDLKKTIVQ